MEICGPMDRRMEWWKQLDVEMLHSKIRLSVQSYSLLPFVSFLFWFLLSIYVWYVHIYIHCMYASTQCYLHYKMSEEETNSGTVDSSGDPSLSKIFFKKYASILIKTPVKVIKFIPC